MAAYESGLLIRDIKTKTHAYNNKPLGSGNCVAHVPALTLVKIKM